jgi:hypothetical protein
VPWGLPVVASQRELRRSYLAGSQPISSFDGVNSGPHYRDSTMMASSAPASAPRTKKKLFSSEFLDSKWAKLFFLIVGLQAVICVTFES